MRNAERFFLLSLGALLGAASGLPLMPWELPEANASLIGSALGAIAAVAGSIWLWRVQQEKQAQDLADYIVESTIDFWQVLCSLGHTLGVPSRPDGPDALEADFLTAARWVVINEQVKVLQEGIPTIQKRLRRIETVAHSLGAQRLLSYHSIEDHIEVLSETLALLHFHLESGVTLNGGAARLSHRQAIEGCRVQISASLAGLSNGKAPRAT